MEILQRNCFICGKETCQQDTDHQKLTFFQFDQLLKTKAGYEPMIVKIKHKVRKCFQKLQQEANLNLQPYVHELFLMIDKLHFWNFVKYPNVLRDIEVAIFGIMLPKNHMIRLIDLIKTEQDNNVKFPKFDKLLQEIHKFKKNGKKVIENSSYRQLALKISEIILECQKEFQKQENLKRKQNSYANQNAGMPTLQQEEHTSQFVIIQGIPFSTMRKSVDLSVLQLTDRLFLSYYSSLRKMRDLTQLQIRNSRLSQRSYKMLFDCFPNLQSLDLSNCDSQNFFKVLGQKLPNIKTLYVNETNLTDQKFSQMLQKLRQIRVIYADHNQLSNQGIQYLFKNKKNMVYASLKSTNLTQEFGIKIQANLVYRGGYVEY